MMIRGTEKEALIGERHMLGESRICANAPVADMARARAFYVDTLGLRIAYEDANRGIYLRAGEGLLNVYERDAEPGKQAIATFLVPDLRATKAELEHRGVRFEEIDLPDLKTRDGIFADGTGFMVAWFKDPDGHVLAIEQHPTTI